jgi:hypothetical protein
MLNMRNFMLYMTLKSLHLSTSLEKVIKVLVFTVTVEKTPWYIKFSYAGDRSRSPAGRAQKTSQSITFTATVLKLAL